VSPKNTAACLKQKDLCPLKIWAGYPTTCS